MFILFQNDSLVFNNAIIVIYSIYMHVPTWRGAVLIKFLTWACQGIRKNLGNLPCPMVWSCRWLWGRWWARTVTDIEQQICRTGNNFFSGHFFNSCIIKEIPLRISRILAVCCIMAARHRSHVVAHSIKVITVFLSIWWGVSSVSSPACQRWQTMAIAGLFLPGFKVWCHIKVSDGEMNKCVELCSTTWSLNKSWILIMNISYSVIVMPFLFKKR